MCATVYIYIYVCVCIHRYTGIQYNIHQHSTYPCRPSFLATYRAYQPPGLPICLTYRPPSHPACLPTCLLTLALLCLRLLLAYLLAYRLTLLANRPIYVHIEMYAYLLAFCYPLFIYIDTQVERQTNFNREGGEGEPDAIQSIYKHFGASDLFDGLQDPSNGLSLGDFNQQLFDL